MKIAAIGILTLGAAIVAQAQSPLVLYVPNKSIKDQSLSVRSWGSGFMAETDELAFDGVYSLRVSTRNYFAGGQMSIANPVNLGTLFGDKNNLLRITVRIADQNLTLGGGRPGGGAVGGPPKAGGGELGGPPAGGGEQGGGDIRGAGGGRQGGGGATAPSGSTPEYDPLKNLRLIFTTTDGMKSEVYVPINTSRPDAKGWISVAVPLQAIRGMDKSNKTISEIGFTGDSVGVFYIGDMRVINDATPITADVNQADMNLALNDEVEFRGRGFGGSSVLRYTWDFDENDGIQEEGEGQLIKRKFRKPGNYVVTLTVHDAYGLKNPASVKIKIKVNP